MEEAEGGKAQGPRLLQGLVHLQEGLGHREAPEVHLLHLPSGLGEEGLARFGLGKGLHLLGLEAHLQGAHLDQDLLPLSSTTRPRLPKEGTSTKTPGARPGGGGGGGAFLA